MLFYIEVVIKLFKLSFKAFRCTIRHFGLIIIGLPVKPMSRDCERYKLFNCCYRGIRETTGAFYERNKRTCSYEE